MSPTNRLRRVGATLATALALLGSFIPLRAAGAVVICVADSHVAIELRHGSSACLENATSARSDLDARASDDCVDLTIPDSDPAKHGDERSSATAPLAAPVGLASAALFHPAAPIPRSHDADPRLTPRELRVVLRVFRI
ncbi:MAG: hypothetical protein U0610_31565 [bacterium]